VATKYFGDPTKRKVVTEIPEEGRGIWQIHAQFESAAKKFQGKCDLRFLKKATFEK